jgi:leucyl aminopeptidase
MVARLEPLMKEGRSMSHALKVSFEGFDAPLRGTAVVFAGAGLALSPETGDALGGAAEVVERAGKGERFSGKALASMVLLAPPETEADRVIVIGTGADGDKKSLDLPALGGTAMGLIGDKAATVMFSLAAGRDSDAEAAAEFALGLALRNYKFRKYKTRKEDDERGKPAAVTILVEDPAAARKAFKRRQAIADGVIVARELVNEPPNVLYPAIFAERAEKLGKLGVEVEVLETKALRKLGMGALLGVAQGSVREPRVVVMRWNGANDKEAPLAFIGKGVTFDTGGISIKSAGGMEDMKGDMAGAACVVGLMHALAARKARINAVGIIGLVENMPDGNAQRPGDIVTSLSGQTIEIINTDAEGRLVLADLLWYAQREFKPAFMVNLATLTGAILVALGTEHAGLFSNDDTLSARLAQAGLATGEKVWRMPLAPEYDKLMDSKFADMKNAGGRHAGSITAAQFLQRFVNDTPWAHLDIAGTGMGAPASAINQSWGSGWGVRLLDRLVADNFE